MISNEWEFTTGISISIYICMILGKTYEILLFSLCFSKYL